MLTTAQRDAKWVTFSPAEIKGLLAEIYIYNDHLDLSGSDDLISAGLLHTVLTNWLGRGSFHYMLDLNDAGEIVGGYFLRDSSRIDMLWLPLRPKIAGEQGHERGNPHVNIDEVLAIWRESVPAETRAAWPIADPAAEDRLSPAADSWQPLQIPGTAAPSTDVAEEDEAVVTGD